MTAPPGPHGVPQPLPYVERAVNRQPGYRPGRLTEMRNSYNNFKYSMTIYTKSAAQNKHYFEKIENA